MLSAGSRRLGKQTRQAHREIRQWKVSTLGPRIRTYVRFPERSVSTSSLTCTKSRTVTTVSKKPIRTVPFPPLEAFLGVIPADRIDPEYAFEPKPLLRKGEGDDSGRRQALENLDSCSDYTLISRAPQPPWRRAPRTHRGQRRCRRAPNRPRLPR